MKYLYNPSRSLVFIFMLMIVFQTWGKQYHFNRLSFDDGLTHNDITSIVQDKDGFMWFATRDGLNRYDGKKIKTYRHPIGIDTLISKNSITSMTIDSCGVIWLGSKGISYYDVRGDSLANFSPKNAQCSLPQNAIIDIKVNKNNWIYFLERAKGIYCYKPEKDELTFYSFQNKEDASFSGTAMWIDSYNRIWLGVNNGTIFYLDEETENFHKFKITCLRQSQDQLQCITGNDHFLYLGFQYSGVIRFDVEKGIFSFLDLYDSKSSDKEAIFVHDILIDGHQLWIGSERGLYIHNEVSQQTKLVQQDYFDPYSLSDNAIYSIYKDNNEGLWIGTYFGGVNYLSLTQNRFLKKYYPQANKNSINGKIVREMVADEGGNLWIGTEDAGLSCFNLQSMVNKIIPQKSDFRNIHGLSVVDDYLYVGNFAAGLTILNLKTGAKTHHYISENQKNVQNSIYSICYDTKKRIWIGTRKGVYLFQRENNTFKRIEEFDTIFAHHIYEDSKGNIWVSTIDNSVACYTNKNELIWYGEKFREKLKTLIPRVLSTFEDSKGKIWFATSGNGLVMYDPVNDSFKHYTASTGLPDNFVYKVIEDFRGVIWFGTNRGLVSLNPKDEKIRILTKNDGLPGNQFNYNSAFRDKAGKLYFGTTNGLAVIDPILMRDDPDYPPALITGFQIYNKEVKIGDESPLKESIVHTEKITLAYNQNTISFDISILQYEASQKNICYVKMDGLQEEWVLLNNELRVSYSNLSPGKYNFRIKTCNSLGDWSEVRNLDIQILPPWWKSSFMLLLYIVLFTVIIAYTFIYIKRRLEKKQELLLKKMELEKEHESYQAKIEFFTNIAHEINTPLTLIKVPLEYIMKNKQFDEDTDESLTTMKNNIDRLLSLTHQLLDFRKVENKRFVLNIELANISDLVKITYDRFKLVAKKRNIEFILSIEEGDLYAHVDVENLTKIISNLFNNALKYSDKYIWAGLKQLDNEFQLIVENDGQLIDSTEHEKIFEPFVQLATKDKNKINSGKGLGLALSRSLAVLHGGTLIFDITFTKYNRFVLTLPLLNKKTESKNRELESYEEQKFSPTSNHQTEKPTLLIVEDNLEMLDFIAKKFKTYYNVLKVTDGLEAIDMLDNNQISLVISDIMMPNMDGFELLKTIKSQIEYSHIPVILLTARTNIQSRIEGLDLGADAYIDKPFSLEHLLVQVENLLKNRQSIKDSFNKQPFTMSKIVALTKADEVFLQKVDTLIEENLMNMQFGIDFLAEKLYMSRSSFHRKIKGLSDLTPNDYIRLYRLKKAASLLQNGETRIGEIAALTGFNSSSYFTKCFQEYFGVTPKKIMKTKNNDEHSKET